MYKTLTAISVPSSTLHDSAHNNDYVESKMYDLRPNTVTPARRLSEGTDHERQRGDILGIVKKQCNVRGKFEQSQPVVPHVVGQLKAIVPQAIERPNVVRGGNDVAAIDRNIQPAAPASSQRQWLALTDTMKLVIVRQTLEQFNQNGAMTVEYLNLNEDEMAEVNRLLIAEFSRNDQFEEDAHALTLAMLHSAQYFTSHVAHDEQIEAVYAKNKKHLGDSAPRGYLVKLKDVEAAKEFVRRRAADSLVRQEILKGIEKHKGKEYNREVINAILADIWEDGDEDGEDDDEDNQ
ncbi:hypothetical protein N431DRAFT_116665 [Stipitochalara longipes BDJ]|nr:hypothetical protein N431DRAFT_116665 [Stipitochalara longipes BDJ]